MCHYFIVTVFETLAVPICNYFYAFVRRSKILSLFFAALKSFLFVMQLGAQVRSNLYIWWYRISCRTWMTNFFSACFDNYFGCCCWLGQFCRNTFVNLGSIPSRIFTSYFCQWGPIRRNFSIWENFTFLINTNDFLLFFLNFVTIFVK
jgi:hypothetical protein